MNDVDFQKLPRVKEGDKLPPSSGEAEAAILGCILLAPASCMSAAMEKLPAGPEVFYEIRHQTIYGGMLALRQGDRGIDTITLVQHLKDQKKLKDAGGLAYVSTLPDGVSTAESMDYYIQIVLEKYLLRKVVQTCSTVSGQAMESYGDTNQVITEFERLARQISDEASRMGAAKKSVQAAAGEAITDWEWAFQHPGEYTGIPCGLVDIDRKTWGWQKEEFIIIGARPSEGKSSLVFGFADVAAVDLRKATLVFSLETSAKACVKRIACRRARVSQSRLREGKINNGELERIQRELPKITGAPLYIVDHKALTISQIASIVRQYKEKNGIELVIVDYLQKVKPDRIREKRTYEVSQVSEGLKWIAEENEIPVIAAAQLNREMDKSQGKTKRAPRLSDLGDSGAIERDADTVGLIYHNDDKSFILMAKLRDGETGIVPVVFNRQFTRFDNMAKVDAEDIPPQTGRLNYNTD